MSVFTICKSTSFFPIPQDRPISRQRLKYAQATTEKSIARSVFCVGRAMPSSRQSVAKHIPATTDKQATIG
jgi:hypothetical protein